MVVFIISSFATGSSSFVFLFNSKLNIEDPIEISLNSMLYFLVSFLSFILLSKSFSHKSFLSWESDLRLFSAWFWDELPSFLVSWFQKTWLSMTLFTFPTVLPLKMMCFSGGKVENVEEKEENRLLDLPELALECILDRLSPAELCSMAAVCRSLRERCRSDCLWEKHLKQKWGKVIGEQAYREWPLHIVSRKGPNLVNQCQKIGLFGSFLANWPFSWIRPKLGSMNKLKSSLPVNSIKVWYLSLENGLFWFPAQVYNRENGHAGFMLSCYDAHLCYDSQTDMFRARYSPYGRRTTEENISWDRVRAPPVDTPPYDLHISDCLYDLKPGDHIEIQWRRNREFPYGWWYGVVGHLETCDGNVNHCHCHRCDTVILEFNQYSPDSRWRRMVINRKDHKEEGNEVDGFYGGIRKLHKDHEITRWKHLSPTQNLE